MIAKILIDISHTLVDKPYDYKVPEYLNNVVKAGMRVKVNFHGVKRQGVILGFKKTSSQSPLKSIESLLELTPSYKEEILEASVTLSNLYARPMWDYLKLFTPVQAQIPSEVRLICEYHPEKYQAIFKEKPFITTLPDHSLIQSGLKNHDLVFEDFQHYPKLDTAKSISLIQEGAVKGSKQQKLMALLKQNPELSFNVLKTHGISSQTIQSLVKQGLIQMHESPSYLYVPSHEEKIQSKGFYEEKIKDLPHIAWIKPGSMESTLEVLKSLLKHKDSSTYTYIVFPEQAMIDLYASYLNEYFPALSIYKVQDSLKKRVEASLRYEAYGMMLGTMHGLAAHIERTDQVIIMDAHDSSYQMKHTPVFELGDLIRLMDQKKKSSIIYLSNHPTFNQLHYFNEHGITPLDFTPQAPLNIKPIDTKLNKLSMDEGLLSSDLLEAMNHTLQKGKKCLILHNFKGRHTHYACPVCQRKARCHDCGEILTLHGEHLICQKDDLKVSLPYMCEQCHVPMIPMYEGLAPVYQSLAKHFPEQRITMIDRANAKLLESLNTFNENGSILLGTQLFTKGFKFKDVGLLAALDLDRMASVKAYDIKFQTMTLIHHFAMVEPKAPLYIQTTDVNHGVIRALKDPDAYYEASLGELEKLKLPPFIEMSQVVFALNDKNRLETLGRNIHSYLKKALRDHVTIIGPSYKMNQGIITLKSTELHHHTKALKNCAKAFIDEVTIEVKHYHYVV